jgi:integrase
LRVPSAPILVDVQDLFLQRLFTKGKARRLRLALFDDLLRRHERHFESLRANTCLVNWHECSRVIGVCVSSQPEDYLFFNGAGHYLDPDDLRKRVLYPAMKKAWIERKVTRAYGFHLFRHSAGSQMQEVTGDLKQPQSFLGHSGIGITSDRYVHWQPDPEIEPMDKLEEGFFGE